MTLGWIKEDIEERFLEAFAVTGGEAMEVRGRECPFCRARFEGFSDLYAHLHLSHSARRPFLMLFGREPGKEDVVRQPVPDFEIDFVDYDEFHLSVDQGEPVQSTRKQFGQLLRKPGVRLVEVHLVSHGNG